MKLDEAQKILQENGLIIEDTFVNTKYIDSYITNIKTHKELLLDLANRIQEILPNLTKKHAKYSIMNGFNNTWYLNVSFGGEGIDFEYDKNKISVLYNINGKEGSYFITLPKLEETINKIFIKKSK